VNLWGGVGLQKLKVKPLRLDVCDPFVLGDRLPQNKKKEGFKGGKGMTTYFVSLTGSVISNRDRQNDERKSRREYTGLSKCEEGKRREVLRAGKEKTGVSGLKGRNWG